MFLNLGRKARRYTTHIGSEAAPIVRLVQSARSSKRMAKKKHTSAYLRLCECGRCGRSLMGREMIEIWDTLASTAQRELRSRYEFVAGYLPVRLDNGMRHERPMCRECL